MYQAEPLAFAQRPVHSDGWILGTRPAWQQPAFEDMFISAPPLVNTSGCSPGTWAWSSGMWGCRLGA